MRRRSNGHEKASFSVPFWIPRIGGPLGTGGIFQAVLPRGPDLPFAGYDLFASDALLSLRRLTVGISGLHAQTESMPMSSTKRTHDPNRPVRIATYCRVSTDGQDAAMQNEDLRRVVSQRGWTVVAEYSDTISGAKEGPERRRLLQDAHHGKFDAVLVWRFDRFARSARDLLLALDTLTALGIEFSSMKEAFDTSTPVGRATITILAAVAELERNIIKERVIAGLEHARRQGRKLGRPERDVDVDRARQLLQDGRTQRQVAMALKVPRSTLRRALARS